MAARLAGLPARARTLGAAARRRVRQQMGRPGVMARGMSLWPPFLGAGISVSHMSEDLSTVVVKLRDTRVNRNWVGTHFGGSLFAMTDAFYMIMLLNQIEKDHVVWDKRSEIEFIAPGRGTLTATFVLEPGRVAEIVDKAKGGDKVLEWFGLDILDEQGAVVAHVDKQLYIRRKRGRA